MSKITVWAGKGKLTLRKSSKLVGLRTTNNAAVEKESFVERAVFPSMGRFNVVELNTDDKNVDEKLDEVRAKEDVEVGTHVYYAEGSDKPIVPTGEIIIEFQDNVSLEEQELIFKEYKLALVERREELKVIAKVTPESPNPLKVASILHEISMIKRAEPDIDTVMDDYFTAPLDQLLDHQWHLQNSGFVADVNFRLKKGADAKVVDAWQRLESVGSPNVVVALIDNGFDISHPDLRDKVYKPYDVWRRSTQLSQGDPSYTHGTPCASVAIAASNGDGIVGVAPGAKFMPIHGTSFDVRETELMFDYCVRNGADIISCSWGTTDPNFQLNQEKEEAIARAAREGRNGKGCVILFAVGNDDANYINYYAQHPDVIAVAASTSQDQHAQYSNRSKDVSICAPSNGDWPIIAARAWWDQGLSYETGNFKFWRDGRSRGKHYKHFGGTSSSTPLVAGICALILSANPDLTAREVKEILQKTADKIGPSYEYSSGHSRKFGYGRVNADKAVAEALRRKERTAPPVEVEPTVSKGQGLFQFSVKKQSPVGWGVQTGVFADYGNVLVEAEKLERQFGEQVIVNINELNGDTVYKIILGAFSDVDDARRLLSTMKGNGVNGFLRNLRDLA